MPRGAHPNSQANLKPRPGKRTRGPARATKAVREIARGMLEDREYRAKLFARMKSGRAGIMEPLLWHYGYGKPKDELRVEGSLPALVIDRVTGSEDA